MKISYAFFKHRGNAIDDNIRDKTFSNETFHEWACSQRPLRTVTSNFRRLYYNLYFLYETSIGQANFCCHIAATLRLSARWSFIYGNLLINKSLYCCPTVVPLTTCVKSQRSLFNESWTNLNLLLGSVDLLKQYSCFIFTNKT